MTESLQEDQIVHENASKLAPSAEPAIEADAIKLVPPEADQSKFLLAHSDEDARSGSLIGDQETSKDSPQPSPSAAGSLSERSVVDREGATHIIDYRPYAAMEKWFAYRFSAWNTPKAWFAMTILILFFACGGPGKTLNLLMNMAFGKMGAGAIGTAGAESAASSINGFLNMMLVLILLLVCLVGVLVYMRHPSHIALGPKKISLLWHRGLLWRSRSFEWNDLDQISVIWPPGKTSPQDCLIHFEFRHGPDLKLKLGAVSTIEDRRKLLDAIHNYGGHARRVAELADMLAAPQNHNYTELWLQALSAPPKRERLAPLHEGALLRDGLYEIVGQLGVGGQGTAYLAKSLDARHEVVLKEFILPVYVDANIRRQAIEKMQNEASILRRLDNDRIVKLIDFFIEDHRGYLVLEKIDGLSLRQKVCAEGHLPEAEVRNLAAQMCEMLQYLHGLEPPVVHRDFTPDNLILGSDGILKLVDFNVAQQQESTATGTVVGKHCYISPEQFRGKPSCQSDIYSMGATLYYLLTGEDPEPITASQPAKKMPIISDELDEIVHKATALDVKSRYSTIGELKTDLLPA
ncbi:MAG TPA: serine/threonine-protein kinase [Candidatus Obscuribacterales bacterium]